MAHGVLEQRLSGSVILRYGFCVASVATALGLSLASNHFGFRDIELPLFTLAIAIITWYAGGGPSALAVVLSATGFNYFFIDPVYTLYVPVNEIPHLLIFVAWALTIAVFAAVRRRAEHEERVERRKAEQALRRSEACLSEAQRLSRTGSFGWDMASGQIYWSDETFRIFECDPATIPTVQTVLERAHPEDRPRVRQTIDRATEIFDFTDEYRLLMPDGSVKHVRVLAHRTPAEDAECVAFVGAVTDVTESKRAEEEHAKLRQLEADLARVNASA